MFFLCPGLKDFWAGYFIIMSTVLGVNLQPSLLARRLLLLHWKSAKCPSISRWLKVIMFFLKLEKIKYTLRGCTVKFFHKWQPFISYFTNLEVLPD